MRTIRVIIADENQSYSRALSEYLQSEYGQAFDISCFTSAKSLTEYLSKTQETDIMLIDQNLYSDSIKEFQVKTVLMLTEISQEHEVNGVIALYKYQLGDKLAKHILKSYDSYGNDKFSLYTQQRGSKLIAVYSPAGGSGKSTIAYNISSQYAMQGKKTIFISMESYASLPMFKADSQTRGLSYLIYLVKNKATNLQAKLDAIKELDVNTNVHYIPRNSNSIDYKDADHDDIAALLDFLKNQSGYDAIILDMDSSVSEKLLSVFKYCDVLLNVIGNDTVSKEKHKSFTDQMDIYNSLLDIKLSEKIIWVYNKIIDSSSKTERETDCSGMVVDIPYLKDISLTLNGYFEELAHFKQLYDAVENIFSDKRIEA